MNDDVEIWRIDLTGARDLDDRVLSASERERADSLVSADERRRFVTLRVAIRTILSGALERAPGSIVFEEGEEGKPRVVDDGSLEFNLAHSGSLALLAVSRTQPVGIDVERKRELKDPLGMAERFFSSGEVAAVRDAPRQERSATFLRVWTCKEALLKGIGTGLRQATATFEVSFGESGARARGRAGDVDAAEWWLREVESGPSFIGAVAGHGEPRPIDYRTW